MAERRTKRELKGERCLYIAVVYIYRVGGSNPVRVPDIYI